LNIQTLALSDFRNYANLDLTLGPGRFVLAGGNAQGKSNLCEAIRLLATMRSFRATIDREMIRWGAEGHFARVSASVHRAADAISVEIVISAPPVAEGEASAISPLGHGGARKRVRINGVPRRALDCVGLVTVVLFEPADLDLVDGPPQGRRHFLDVTLCQIDHAYCRNLSHLQRVIAQRSALLRRIRDSLDEPRALDYWDEQFASLAVPITRARTALVARLAPTADDHARRLSGGASLHLAYLPSFQMDLHASDEAALHAFREKLARLRAREIAQGANLLGPHRDDLAFFGGPVDLAVYGSRGQQRTAALALKLAELKTIEAETGDQPILVLDDVLSELDSTRRGALLGSIGGLEQVILTTAEPESVPAAFIEQARMLNVQSGTIKTA
jgi:DNA replication and repair protein RecF